MVRSDRLGGPPGQTHRVQPYCAPVRREAAAQCGGDAYGRGTCHARRGMGDVLATLALPAGCASRQTDAPRRVAWEGLPRAGGRADCVGCFDSAASCPRPLPLCSHTTISCSFLLLHSFLSTTSSATLRRRQHPRSPARHAGPLPTTATGHGGPATISARRPPAASGPAEQRLQQQQQQQQHIRRQHIRKQQQHRRVRLRRRSRPRRPAARPVQHVARVPDRAARHAGPARGEGRRAVPPAQGVCAAWACPPRQARARRRCARPGVPGRTCCSARPRAVDCAVHLCSLCRREPGWGRGAGRDGGADRRKTPRPLCWR